MLLSDLGVKETTKKKKKRIGENSLMFAKLPRSRSAKDAYYENLVIFPGLPRSRNARDIKDSVRTI